MFTSYEGNNCIIYVYIYKHYHICHSICSDFLYRIYVENIDIIHSIMCIKPSALKEFDWPLDNTEDFSLELILDPIKYKFEYFILAKFKYITCAMNIVI